MVQGVIQGKVVDASGKPVAKASVTTSPATKTATTDALGAYKIDNVPAGVYTLTATAAGYALKQGQVSVTASGTASADLALGSEAPFSLIALRGVGYRTKDPYTYPDGVVRLTTHYSLEGDPLTHGENQIQTSGLPNVAVGGYVFLQGKAEDAAAKAIKGWSWAVKGPLESTVAVTNATSQTPCFVADKAGKYEVTLAATNSDGAVETDEILVYAGTYVGSDTCLTCHSGSVMHDTAVDWMGTGHANQLYSAYPMYTATRDYCIACHTTGYDQADKGNGFDDLAKQAGWDPSKASLTGWLIANKYTVDTIKTSVMAKLANIQCEACHGPGLIHEGVAYAVQTGAIYNPSVCSQCHPQEYQLRNSPHYTNTGYKNLHTAEGASCVECHTGQGFVQVKANGQPVVFPTAATADQPATLLEPSEQPVIGCATCHDSHQATDPFIRSGATHSLQLRFEGNVTMPNGATVNAKESAVCVECHANKRNTQYMADFLAGKNSRGVHDNPQADVLYGVGAVSYGVAYQNSAHTTVVDSGCITCHMATKPTGTDAIGEHSFNMVGTINGATVENVNGCKSCHTGVTDFNLPANADYDGNGKVQGVQDEVQGLLDAVAAQLPKDSTGAPLSSGITATNTNDVQRKALWNYYLIKNDGSKGVHNTAFAVTVLQATYESLTGKTLGSAYRAAPTIPHAIDEAHTTCTNCHTVGGSAPLGMPPSHAGRTVDTCQSCHKPAA